MLPWSKRVAMVIPDDDDDDEEKLYYHSVWLPVAMIKSSHSLLLDQMYLLCCYGDMLTCPVALVKKSIPTTILWLW